MNLETIAIQTEKIIQTIENDDQIRTSLSRFRHILEVAKTQKTHSLTDITKYQTKLQELESKFRSDSSDRQMRQAASYANKRHLLLTSTNSATTTRKDILGQVDLLSISKDTNASLIRTQKIVAKELVRVIETNQILLSNGEVVRDISEQNQEYDEGLKTSRQLLKNIQKREYTDKLLLKIGFGFFIVVSIYIIHRRIKFLFQAFSWIVMKFSSLADSKNGQKDLTDLDGFDSEL